MSLLMYALYWVVIPVIAILIASMLIRGATTRLSKRIATALCVAGFVWLFWILAGGEKWLLDRQVSELCRKDGGVKVYETVSLPAELLDQAGRISIPDKNRAKPTDKYYYETERYYYRQGNPEVSRRKYQILRRSDQKVLGELVIYGRGGGDLPGPWHDSSYTCPNQTQIPNFESSIFVKGDK